MRVRLTFHARFGAASLAFIACCGSRDTGGTSGSFRQDSAGVSIINVADKGWRETEPWRVADLPKLRIGAANGPEHQILGRVVGAARRGDGLLAVADASIHAIRLYGEDGDLVWQAGRRGQGPGEFESIESIWVTPGDSLVVVDLTQYRATVIDPAGAVARMFRVGPAPEPLLAARPTSDGRYVFRTRNILRLTSKPQILRDSMRVYLYDPTGNRLSQLVQLPGVMSYGLGTMKTSVVPFSPEPTMAVRGNDVLASEGVRFEYHVFDLSGNLRRIVRLEREPERIHKDDIASWRSYYLQLINTLGDGAEPVRQDLDRLLAEVPMPATTPAFSQIIADADGYVWLRMFQWPPEAGVSRWSLFSPTDEYLGDVAFPADLAILEIGRDHVIGTGTFDGIPELRVYALARGETKDIGVSR